MADVYLSVSPSTGKADVDRFRKGIEDIIKKVDQNPPKVSVGLTVSEESLKAFKKRLEDIMRSVSTDSGKPITLKIDGLGELTTETKKVESASKKAGKAAENAGKKAATSFKEAQKVIRSYYDIQRKIASTNGDVALVAGRYTSASGNHSALADEANRTAAAYQNLKGILDTLPADQQIKIKAELAEAERKYALAIEDRANRQRKAEEKALEREQKRIAREEQKAARAAEQANTKANEGYNYEQQLNRVDKLLDSVNKKLVQFTAAKHGKSSQDYDALEESARELEDLRDELLLSGKAADNFGERYGDIAKKVQQSDSRIRASGENVKSFGDRIGGLAEKFGTWLTISQAVMATLRALKQMVQTVIELDTAMTELKKVTNATDAAYDRFLDNAVKRAKEVGASLVDVVSATADFARLGHSIEDASKIADAALVYKNVGDGIEDVAQASESIISTMQAFGIETSAVMSIVDKFNEVGNKFAISSTGIGDAMQRSAAAMRAANNSLEQTIALITAANEVVQNPETVGTTLKTVSMYLRAAKTEAEEAGESTDGMAESVSELRQNILDLTGQRVDIQVGNEFKSTYQILKELSEVWNSGVLTDISKANILEMIGGKRNANVVSALLENFSTAEKALKAATNATGSALAENEKYLASIEGRINKFRASWQSLAHTIVNNNAIKYGVEAANALVSSVDWLIDKLDVLGISMLAVPTVAAVAKLKPVKEIMKAVGDTAKQLAGGAK